jgi:L-asparaginase
LFNAGIGSQIQADGKSGWVLLWMARRKNLAVSLILKHKISSSRPKLMQYDDRVLGSGATNFARENGFGSFSAETPQRRAE